MKTLVAQISDGQFLQIADGIQLVVGLILLVIVTGLVISWVLLPWLVIRRLERISKQIGQIHDEIASTNPNSKSKSSVRYGD
jgi:hypothetical protein